MVIGYRMAQKENVRLMQKWRGETKIKPCLSDFLGIAGTYRMPSQVVLGQPF